MRAAVLTVAAMAAVNNIESNATDTVLTVEEAAKVLKIGRRLAYELAARFEATGGKEGLPVIRLGRCLRVPLSRLNAMLAADPTPPPVLRSVSANGLRFRTRR